MRSRAAEIAIHVGAHKTATTHLQRILDHQREPLSEHGVAYFGPRQIRPYFKEWRGAKLRRPFSSRKYEYGIAALVKPALKTADRIVISEENLLGYCRHIFNTRALYRDTRRRMENIADAFRRLRIVVHLAIRDYATFFPSAYVENLRDGGVVGFPGVSDAPIASPRGWPDIVEDIAFVVGAENIRLWRYEDHRLRHSEIIAALTGVNFDVSTRQSASVAREGMSHDAVAEIERLAGAGEWPMPRERMVEVGAAFPKGAHPAFDPFTADEKARLTERYERDVEHLRARFPGAWILDAAGGS